VADGAISDGAGVAVLGVVDPFAGAGGVHDGADDTWSFRLRLLHWQVDGFPLADGPLEVWRAGLDRDDLEELLHGVAGGAVVRVEVRLGDERPGAAEPTARLVGEVAHADPSDELAAARTEALRETVVEHPLGRFVHTRAQQAFTGVVAWPGGPIEAQVCVQDADDAHEALDRLASWLEEAEHHDAAFRRHAADELLDTLNDAWIDPDQPIVTEAEFLRRLRPRVLLVACDGAEVGIDHDDDGMFWGHLVQVRGTFAAGPLHATL
jgi:hypothetical protein